MSRNEPILTEMKDETKHRNSRRVALVTGATGTIGKAIATRIASRPEYEVVLLCRNAAKARAAVADIRQQPGNARVRSEIVDLARRDSVAALAERWEGFKARYFTELDAKHDALSALAETSRGGRLTLLFAARDPVHNNAVALREYLLRASRITLEEIGDEPE